ncbi:hypothetical protein PBAC_32660 [Pedobacter glucosidilyticus]|nr:hypothetical protein [Pedobacter glucosidilyticus]KHJ36564.1 hypothetical protein PBAC_32660 [Pedobacter glucosidilyticus]
MRINISHEDLNSVIAGSAIGAWLATKIGDTGVPQINAGITAIETLLVVGGATIGLYDHGNGIYIDCPLYVPATINGY